MDDIFKKWIIASTERVPDRNLSNEEGQLRRAYQEQEIKELFGPTAILKRKKLKNKQVEYIIFAKYHENAHLCGIGYGNSFEIAVDMARKNFDKYKKDPATFYHD
jgi:hypothetical protein